MYKRAFFAAYILYILAKVLLAMKILANVLCIFIHNVCVKKWFVCSKYYVFAAKIEYDMVATLSRIRSINIYSGFE